MKNLYVVFLVLCTSGLTFARGGGGGMGGGSSLGAGLILATPNQQDINTYIDSTATSGTKNLSSGYEFFAHYTYKFSSTMFSLQFRPSYFTQTASGGGIDASLSGITFFPILRLTPLENNFIKFFLQAGVGYGSLTGSISNSSTSGNISYKGDAFGAMAGLGADFCFTPNHCMGIEGNLRYLPIVRNMIESGGGQSLGGNVGTTTPNGTEFESGTPAQDVKTTLSGILGVLSYTYNF